MCDCVQSISAFVGRKYMMCDVGEDKKVQSSSVWKAHAIESRLG